LILLFSHSITSPLRGLHSLLILARFYKLKIFSQEEGQAFYAGGSETSGQQILGPPKKKDGRDFVKEMFKKAREHGAEAVDPASGANFFCAATKAAVTRTEAYPFFRVRPILQLSI
jgi:hypothetical protein